MHRNPRTLRPWLSMLGAGACSLAAGQGPDEIFADDFESCRAPTQFIYAVDSNNALLRFDPTALAGTPIQSLGALTCNAGSPLPPQPSPAVPVSMSVDRDGNIWVLYTSGELFSVDPGTLACSPTTFVIQQDNFNLFNMAFAGPGGPATQAIYIDGGSVDFSSLGGFGWIDRSSLQIQSAGSLMGAADYTPPLAGTGDLALYGLYISTTTTTYIREIDRTNGTTLGALSLSSGIFDGNQVAWAFAFWGGKFWIFVTRQDPVTLAQSTALYSVDRVTGSQQTEIGSVPFSPVAAGSSTCVPVTAP